MYLSYDDAFYVICLTHYQTTNLRLFQTERVCRRRIKFDENARKLSKRVENTVGKGEIARYEQFLLFPQFFQNACFPGASKGVIGWEWVNLCPADVMLLTTTQTNCNLLIFYQTTKKS